MGAASSKWPESSTPLASPWQNLGGGDGAGGGAVDLADSGRTGSSKDNPISHGQ